MAKIGIDARIMFSSTGRYIQELLKHLQLTDHENEYYVLMNPKDMDQFVPSADNFHKVAAPFGQYSFAEQIGFAKLLYSLKLDLVHFTMPQQPLFYFGKRVTTVHDTTLVRFENIDMNPLVYRTRKLIFTGLLKNVIYRSKVILTPTEYVRNDLIDFTSQKRADKLRVTLEAGSPLGDEPESIPYLEGKPFLFWVGNAFPYKNIGRIVDTFEKLKKNHPELQLLLAGKKDIFYEQIEQDVAARGIADVYIPGFISEGEKRWAFQNAECYIVASLSEGFHIPGLEAMYEQCAVASSNATCLPEVYGNAAEFFDPLNVDDMVRAVESIIGNIEHKTNLIAAGNERVKQFSWQRMTDQTIQAYNDALAAK